ncbi:hypothetical protein [Luteimonas sp. MHLX1A]|uniref:hypothetical protein n=1 Tax=Alterluteimonas muca TaxID=2878684 RepID=UPI001E63587E|nr:hypothetical protein [Luteimonas sp. MHLX1A]MCD9046923.1 hypothetical protein [Luteimonas sp. MHLX1A]
MQLKIENGPFNGTEFNPTDTYEKFSDDGSSSNNVLLAKLTQTFLSVFDPLKGWGVSITAELEKLDLVPLSDAFAERAAQYVPTARFLAKLVNPQGVVVATASTLWTIDGPTAWEKGETNARTRLYEAVGLQSKFGNAGPSGGGYVPRAKLHAVPTREQKRVEVKPAESADSSTTPPAGVENEATASAQVQTTAPEVQQAAPTTTTSAPQEPSSQSRIDLGDGHDPDAPPQAMQIQIERLAKLMGKTVPVLRTRAEATQFLTKLQRGEG